MIYKNIYHAFKLQDKYPKLKHYNKHVYSWKRVTTIKLSMIVHKFS